MSHGMHDDDTALLNEEGNTEWHVFLTKFERDVWPMMKHHGFSRDTALIVFEMNRVQTLLAGIQEALASEED